MPWRFVFLGLTLLAARLGAAEDEKPIGEHLVYKHIEDRDLAIYWVRPADWKATDHRPGLVFYHGGSWVGGTPAQFNQQAQYFASRGLVCFLVQYRLLPAKSTMPPAVSIQDARSAFRWVRQRATEFGVDAHRLGAGGGSAGGHLAACLGLMSGNDDPTDNLKVSARPDALLLFNPVLDNGPTGFGFARTGERYREFSPAHNVSPGAPPTVLFLGSEDPLIPVATLEKFAAEMKGVGVRCELHVYPGQKHGFFNPKPGDDKYFRLTTRAADEFLVALGWLNGAPILAAPAKDGS